MKLFLIDGHALVFKMYYAFLGRPMVNSKGVDTSILFGFTKYLLELIDREKPTHIAVSFDPPGGSFRNTIYPEYKANRSETPQLVIDALEPLISIVKALDIPVLMIKGFEADDVIGSMARRSAAEGFDVYMVTHDKDYGQLVAPHVFQYKPGKSGADNEVIDEAGICEKWGIERPSQVVDILTICGDSSDNVPGVQGVGPVGAAKFLSKYGTVENIYAHLSELTPKQQEMFKAAMDHLPLSKKLVTIKTDIPLMVSADQMVLNTNVGPELTGWLDRYEMPSLKRHVAKIWGDVPQAQSAAPVAAAPATIPDDLPEPALFEHQAIGELDYLEVPAAEIAAEVKKLGKCAVVVSNGKVTLATGSKAGTANAKEFKAILTDPSIIKCGFSMKSQMNELAAEGIELQGRLLDSELMHYLLNPERSHQLEMLAEHYLGLSLEGKQPEESLGSLFDADGEATSDKPDSREAVIVFLLAEKLRSELGDGKAAELYEKIEEPLIKVLARMEQVGVRIDPESLRDFSDGLRKTVLEKEQEVRDLAGVPTLNVSSPKQIGEVLFEKLRIDPQAKKPAKGSWPTDEETLLKYSDANPIIDAILDYRGTKKLLSTYIEPLPGYISSKDGRVHTTFNQALTSTGRLSSSNPNLQNIPVRTEQGREIRKAFTAPKGSVIMSADYSQIELRLMAHLCGDAHMIQAFREGQDVHAAMAAKIFRKPLAEVTPDDRRVAKTANFGIMYGISSFGLAQRLHVPRTVAAQIIDDYFASFPTIRSFIDGTLESARRTGYVETIFGRRRYVPDVNSHNGNIRAMAERNAVNAPIQGSAADIIKLAMIGVDQALREQGLRSRMVLQIHDELVLEVPEDEIQPVKRILTEQMEGVMTLSVPLTVECNYGKNWLEAH